MKPERHNIIFLDIDGVLNSTASRNFARDCMKVPIPHTDLPAPALVENLNLILDSTDARIVISSSWRIIYSIIALADIFYLCGVRPQKIIDKTPDTKRGYDGRYLEIQLWIKHNHKKMKNFVVIDDCDDALLPNRPGTFIKTDFEIGLTREQAHQACEILNGKSNSSSI